MRDENEPLPSDVPEELVKKVASYMDPEPKVAPKASKPKKKSSKTADNKTAPVLAEESQDSEKEPIIPNEVLPALDKIKDEPDEEPEKKIIIEEPNEESDDQDAQVSDTSEPEQEDIVKTEQGDEPSTQDSLEGKDIDEAVEDIVAKESDQVLLAEDEKNLLDSSEHKSTPRSKIKSFFVSWFTNSRYRRLTILVVVTAILLIMFLPPSRYMVLNSVGVRAGASVVVVDEKTLLPLKNVQVKIAEKTSVTDDNGIAQFSSLRLGNNTLTIEKRAFATINRTVTIGWGSNPLGSYNLEPVGVSYRFKVVDFLSGDPIVKAEASYGDASAFSNNDGQIVLVVDQSEDSSLVANIMAKDYRTEAIALDDNLKDEVEVKLVPSRPHVFISKRSGKFDVYKIDVDGNNEQLLLPASGVEREDMTLVQHPTDNVVVLVSTRLNERNKDGFLLSSLTLIDIDSKESSRVDLSERIQIVQWIGDRLIYVKITEGSSASDSSRHRLISYSYKSETHKELARSNYFNDILVAENNIYYSPSSYNLEGSVGLYRVSADGTSSTTILDKEVWNIFRTAYDKLALSVGQNWYAHTLGQTDTSQLPGPPGVLKSRLYTDRSLGDKSVWIDERDGQGTLLLYDKQSKQETTLYSVAGLVTPVYWLNDNYVIFRVNDSRQVADYVMNINAEEPRKIRDVTDTSGIDNWYYY